jgi:hypothetical protein
VLPASGMLSSTTSTTSATRSPTAALSASSASGRSQSATAPAGTRRGRDLSLPSKRCGTRAPRSSDAPELSGLLLLRDLKQLYLTAQETEIEWVVLAQAAQAIRDRELLRVAGECHEEAQECGK